ncbi:hypothetical protein AN478_03790 [Thiohalorhabdus denitrificans]|nr:hypothetical protein AN478_03790 [Thiohalorhabdus denitrificans]
MGAPGGHGPCRTACSCTWISRPCSSCSRCWGRWWPWCSAGCGCRGWAGRNRGPGPPATAWPAWATSSPPCAEAPRNCWARCWARPWCSPAPSSSSRPSTSAPAAPSPTPGPWPG